MKSAFCPVIRNNSPPARRQHIAKVCCFPIGTRLNFRQSRITHRPTKQKARSSNRTGSHPFSEATPLRKPSPAPCQSRKPAPLFGSPSAPCQSRKLTPLRNPSSSFWFPRQSRKPFDTPPGQLFFLVRFADFSCARSRIPAILKPLFNPDRRRLYEKIWLNLCSRVRKRPKKSNLSKGLAHAS